MSDLRRWLAEWRQPFEESPLYSDGVIHELEDHLRAVLLETPDAGEVEFRSAAARVGREADLRNRYLEYWRETNPVRRWWTRIRIEGRMSTHPRGYRVFRLLSLAAGTLGLLALVSLLVTALKFGLLPNQWESGKAFHLQSAHGWALAVLGLFNMTPFEAWRGRTSDFLRAGAASWLLYGSGLAITTTGLYQLHEQLWWMAVVLVGPILWALQLRWRRDVRPLQPAP